MVSDPRRFQSPSDGLEIGRLWAETRRYVVWGLLIGIGLFAGLVVYLTVAPEERSAPPPAITRLVIRKPRSTKSFTLKRQRLRPRAMTKQVTALKPQLEMPSARRLTGPSTFGHIQTFEYAISTDVRIDLKTSPIELSAARISGTKEPEKRIAMREELIDLNALDTGKYKGLIIQDPTDRRKVKGFVYLGTAWANDLEPTFDSAAKAVPNLVDALNAQTGISAQVDAHLFIDSQELFRTPFVYITAQEAFELTEREIQIYHTFYDFDGPPVGSELEVGSFDAQRGNETVDLPETSYHLEGIFLGDRLVAIYSDKGYVHTWARNYGNEPQLRFGINVVIFALTQEGSIAQQQIDFYSQRGE